MVEGTHTEGTNKMTPQQEGYKAFYKGIRFDERPRYKNQADVIAWNKGYREAEKLERDLMMTRIR